MEGRKEGRKERWKEGRKEERKEGRVNTKQGNVHQSLFFLLSPRDFCHLTDDD